MVTEARRIVEEYEEEQEQADQLVMAGLTKLRKWLIEKALFADCAFSLSCVKHYERMTVEEAIMAGDSMEDRNEPPLLIQRSASDAVFDT